MPDNKQSIILGGLVTGLLSTSYLGYINFICCLGILAGALVAVWHYTDTHELTIPTGKGATMGIMAALFGLLISTVLNYVLVKAGINHETAFTEFILNMFGDSMPPEQVEAMEAQMEQEKTALQYLLGIGGGVIVSSIFGAIGGSIGAKMFKKGGDEPMDSDIIEEL